MATFDLGQFQVRGAVKAWRPTRAAAMYAAGLLGGIALGLGVAAYTVSGMGASGQAPASVPAAGEQTYVVYGSPASSEPTFAAAEQTFTTPIQTNGNFAAPPDRLVVVPEFTVFAPALASDPAPIVDPAPAAPAAPAAPSEPAASLPQTQPAPQADPAPANPVETAPEPAPEPAKPNFYVPAASGGPLNGLEQRFFDAANKERVAAGMAPFALDSGLTKIARTRSQQLVDQGYFGHTDPYGYSMYVELLAHFGYTSYAWAGENLAMNNFAESESPERAMVALMNSPTHKANILSPSFSRLGVGLVTMADGRKYYTMIFLS